MYASLLRKAAAVGTVATFHAADGAFQYDSVAVADEPTDKGYDTYLVDPC